MKSTLFSFSALVLLAAANPSGCVHAPEATTTETATTQAEAAATDTTTVTEATAEEAGDPAIDKMIDAYEQYVDENLKLMQRTLDGDLAAMTDFGPVVEKAQQVHASLLAPGIQQKMSKAQERRMEALEAKYNRVAAQIEQRGIRVPVIGSERDAEHLEERMEKNAQQTQHAMEKMQMQMEDMEKGMQEGSAGEDDEK